MTASFKFRFKWNCRNNFCLGAAVLPNFHMHSTSHTCLLLLHNVCKVTSSIQSPLQIIHHVFWNKTVLWRIYLSDCWSFDGKWCILRLRFLSIRSFFFFFFCTSVVFWTLCDFHGKRIHRFFALTKDKHIETYPRKRYLEQHGLCLQNLHAVLSKGVRSALPTAQLHDKGCFIHCSVLPFFPPAFTSQKTN